MLKNLVDWGNSCKLKFNPEKTIAVLFTRKRKAPTHFIKFEGKILQYSDTVRYLGVELDNKLHWKTHIEQKIKNAKRAIMSISNLMTKSRGPSPKIMRWAYEGIVKPMFTYGALVWAHELNTDLLKEKLIKLNRLALNTFCIAPRSTPTRLLEVMLDIMPLIFFAKRWL